MCCVNLEIDLFISSLWCFMYTELSSDGGWVDGESRMCYSQWESLVIADNLSFVIGAICFIHKDLLAPPEKHFEVKSGGDLLA